MADQYVLFDEPYPIKKKVPCRVVMAAIDKKLPPASVMEGGAEYIRWYWNNKNYRKRARLTKEVLA